MIEIANNGTTKVVRDGNEIIKYMPKTFCDNECHAIESMFAAAQKMGEGFYVPYIRRVGIEEVRIQFFEQEPITDVEQFMSHYRTIICQMLVAQVRHGDLTKHSIIPWQNKPIVIDWSESRHSLDTRDDKRPEGDEYWLWRSMTELCDAS